MYTVARFISDFETLEEVREIVCSKFGEASCSKVSKSHFACNVSFESSWEKHQLEITQFISSLEDILSASAIRQLCSNVEIGFDIAIECEDYENRLYFPLGFSKDFLRKIVNSDFTLELTYY